MARQGLRGKGEGGCQLHCLACFEVALAFWFSERVERRNTSPELVLGRT